jgi:hypothetical protein
MKNLHAAVIATVIVVGGICLMAAMMNFIMKLDAKDRQEAKRANCMTVCEPFYGAYSWENKACICDQTRKVIKP